MDAAMMHKTNISNSIDGNFVLIYFRSSRFLIDDDITYSTQATAAKQPPFPHSTLLVTFTSRVKAGSNSQEQNGIRTRKIVHDFLSSKDPAFFYFLLRIKEDFSNSLTSCFQKYWQRVAAVR
jgi:hypothetical protein